VLLAFMGRDRDVGAIAAATRLHANVPGRSSAGPHWLRSRC
jgi:hypothetical protein